MRPRHIAAENLQRDVDELSGLVDASMRPRHIAAENSAIMRRVRGPRPCFNEAAAYSRGKHFSERTTTGMIPGFNEAAAYSRGKPPNRTEPNL